MMENDLQNMEKTGVLRGCVGPVRNDKRGRGRVVLRLGTLRPHA